MRPYSSILLLGLLALATTALGSPTAATDVEELLSAERLVIESLFILVSIKLFF